MRIGPAMLIGALLALAACGSQPAQNAEAAAPPEASAGDAMASDMAVPPAGENADVAVDAGAAAPDAARPDFGEPAAKTTVKK